MARAGEWGSALTSGSDPWPTSTCKGRRPQAVNEGASTVGAVFIPGTNPDPDPNSFMLSCIGSGDNRPFNANDKIALNYLY